MKEEQLFAWSKAFNLVINRVKMVNHVLGGGCDGCLANPCVMRLRRGRYHVMLGESEYCSFRLYDVSSVERAYVRLDSLADGLWLVRRGGFTFPQPTIIN